MQDYNQKEVAFLKPERMPDSKAECSPSVQDEENLTRSNKIHAKIVKNQTATKIGPKSGPVAPKNDPGQWEKIFGELQSSLDDTKASMKGETLAELSASST